ncbi:MAG TPA: transglycosylase SLT domain-containing protein [Oligoflexia bacterium]|nr:transglycosylase SLT domain-containing protein [Oligoflexia bacterium]HMR23883.1 transglycosylase SLT domain-containing protein [Oligoflexia bacterium]
MPICKNIFFLVLLWFGVLYSNPYYETNLNLQCSQDFPCPESIKDRVTFWVAVFSKYGSDQVVFHDSKVPSRVFSTLDTDIGCIRKNNHDYHIIEKERTRVEKALYALHSTLSQKKTLSPEQEILYDNFKDSPISDILDSAQRVRCQNGNKTRFEQGLKIYNQYKNHIEKILLEHNVSLDIQYLPFVESAYNPKAYSRVGAAGLWQIMPATARRLGLQVNASIDERFDPILATIGAAKYLKNSQEILDNYLINLGFGSNNQLGPYIITSYNYGVGGAKKMLRDVGLDYGKVLEAYTSRRSGVAVQNFYSSFLAARYVAINRQKYFPHINNDQASYPMVKNKFTLKEIRSAEHITEFFNVDLEEFKQLNPVLTNGVIKGKRNIPEGTSIYLPTRLNITPAVLEDYWRHPFVDKLLLEQKYKVAAGDTACGIAREFNISCKELIDENALGRRGLIRVGQIITIPSRQRIPSVVAVSSENTEQPKMESSAPKIEPSENIKSVKNEAPIASVEFIGPPLPPKLAIKKEQGPMDASIEETLYAEGIGESLFIEQEKRNNVMYYSIHVESEETLGHYAEWLKLPNTASLRMLNKMPNSNIVIDEKIYLPINESQAAAKIKAFESNRIDFHKSLHDRFNEHFIITELQHYTVESGDNLSMISKKFKVPTWLIRRFNPEIKHLGLQKGESLKIPVLKEKEAES